MKLNNDSTVVLSLKLFVICLFVALGLSSLNYITKDTIAAQTKKQKDDAMARIITNSEEFKAVNDEETVYAALKDGETVGYCVNVVSPKGYGGNIELMIGFDSEYKVLGIEYISMAETPGLGMNAKTDSAFNGQFLGKEAFSDDELQAMTGATVTSKAVNYGVNLASDMIKEALK